MEKKRIMGHYENRCIRWCYAFFYASLLLAGPGAAQTFFEEMGKEVFSTERRIRDFASPWNALQEVTLGDYNNDGWPDLFITYGGGGAWGALLHNEGGKRFVDQPAALPVDQLPQNQWAGLQWGDYDNDGDLDLFLSGGFFNVVRFHDALLRNDRGVFHNVTREAGLTDSLFSVHAIWFDYDRDGHLDLFVAHADYTQPAISHDTIYRNNGDGSFTEVSEELGLSEVYAPGFGGGTNSGAVSADFNDDGLPDLYLGQWEKVPNRLFTQNDQGIFDDATTGDLADPGLARGTAVGDIDNDGDLDIFQANQAGDDVKGLETPARSLLLLNLGDGQFLDITEAVGLSSLFAREVAFPKFGDIDNDGDLDLVTALPPSLFLNDGSGSFVEQTSRYGVEQSSDRLYLADYDLDGFLDIFISGTIGTFLGEPDSRDRLYHNTGNDNHWLRVELVGTESNRNGIGARLFARAGDLHQTREMQTGWGRGNDERVVHFGLGPRTRVDSLKVNWPSGRVDVLTDLAVDQKIRLFEGNRIYSVARPSTWEHNLPDIVIAGQPLDVSVVVHPILFEPGAQITRITADLSALGGSAEETLTELGEGSYGLETRFEASRKIEVANVPVFVQQMFLNNYNDQNLLYPFWHRSILRPADWDATLPDSLVLGETIDVAATVSLKLPPLDTIAWFESFGALRGAPPPTLGVVVADLSALGGEVNETLVEGENETYHLQKNLVVGSQGIVRAVSVLIEQETSVGTHWIKLVKNITLFDALPTAVLEEHNEIVPQTFALAQNYPNPFNSATTIRFALPSSSRDVELSIHNLAVQKVETLVQGPREAGTYAIDWDGRDNSGRELASGVYLYRLQTGDGSQMETRKLLLIR
jgi:enediyne biosynthesis protein E4